nr:uncharacterized protein LOC113827703 [Penaeus vannamei]
MGASGGGPGEHLGYDGMGLRWHDPPGPRRRWELLLVQRDDRLYPFLALRFCIQMALDVAALGRDRYETTLGNETLQHMYTEDGEYQVMVSGYNPVQGWIHSDPFNITILTEIQGFELTDDGNVLEPNVTKIVTASFLVLPPLSCLMVDLGDNSSQVTFGYESMCKARYPDAIYRTVYSNPLDIEHVYNDEGIYKVRGIAWDPRVTLTMELQVVIADVPCMMPVVSVVEKVQFPQSAPDVWRSMGFQRSTVATINCTRTVPVIRWWTVTMVDKWTGDPLKDVLVENVISSWNYSQINIPALFLQIGVYKLTYYLTLECSKIFPLTRSDFTHVEIIASPLQAVIMQGSVSAISRGTLQSALLDPGSLSVDPDAPKDKNFNITWWCRQVSPIEEIHQLAGNGFPVEYNEQEVPPAWDVYGMEGGGCFAKGHVNVATWKQHQPEDGNVFSSGNDLRSDGQGCQGHEGCPRCGRDRGHDLSSAHGFHQVQGPPLPACPTKMASSSTRRTGWH